MPRQVIWICHSNINRKQLKKNQSLIDFMSDLKNIPLKKKSMSIMADISSERVLGIKRFFTSVFFLLHWVKIHLKRAFVLLQRPKKKRTSYDSPGIFDSSQEVEWILEQIKGNDHQLFIVSSSSCMYTLTAISNTWEYDSLKQENI